MREQEIRGLYEAYASIYEQQTPADRARNAVGHQRQGTYGDDHQMKQDMDAININLQKLSNPSFKGVKKNEKSTTQVAHYDLFDVIKGHLLDEGYADTEEAAEAIMANMSEEWRQSIVEAGFPNVSGNLGGPNPIDPVTGKSKYKMISDPKTGKPTEIQNPNFGKLQGV